MATHDLTIPTGSDYTKTFTMIENGVAKNLTGYSATFYIIKKPGVLSAVSFSTTSGHITNGGATGVLTLELTPADIATIDGQFYKLEIDDGTIQTEVLTGNLFVLNELRTGVEYLIPELRWRLGDIDSSSYRYTDAWLRVALIMAVKALQRWWGGRYLVDDTTYTITRSTLGTFSAEEPPVIQQQDEVIIVLMAAILTKEGSLENSAWSIGSWRDAEIAVSNIESGRIKESSLGRFWNELLWYIQPPTKRLFVPTRDSIPGAEENSA